MILITILNAYFFFVVICNFDKLPVSVIVIAVFLKAFMVGVNTQVMDHYFIHQPFFRSKRQNDLFSIINMFSLLAPQALYQEHHLNHHTHNNRVIARDGVSQGDVSSVFLLTMEN